MYDRRITAYVSIGSLSLRPTLPADPRRVCLIISCTTGPVIFIGYNNGLSTTAAYLSVSLTVPYTMPLRDWGPVVQDVISIGDAGAAGLRIFLVEILKLPGCD